MPPTPRLRSERQSFSSSNPSEYSVYGSAASDARAVGGSSAIAACSLHGKVLQLTDRRPLLHVCSADQQLDVVEIELVNSRQHCGAQDRRARAGQLFRGVA